MKVCLIGLYDDGQGGLRCLETTLDEAGHSVDLIFLKSYRKMFHPLTEVEYNLLVGLVKDLKPDIIGITVRSPFIWLTKEITDHVRGIAPVIWGGFHTTVAPEYAIKYPDMILRGEADRTFPLLLEKLSNKGDLASVPGLWWKDGDTVLQNPVGPPIEDLDSLPFPLVKREQRWYIEDNSLSQIDPLLLNSLMIYPTLASRGCPQRCSYCANAALMKIFGRATRVIRMRDPARVVEEVKRFQEKFGKIEIVEFMDEVFGYKPEWVARFCDIWKKDLATKFAFAIHPSLVKEKSIVKLKNAGLFYVNMGIQSGSERVRDEIYDRPVSNEKILEAAQILHQNGIGYRVEFIFGNPLEEAEDVKQTLDLLLALPRPFISARYQLTHFPGTPLTERLLKEGKITNNDVVGYSERRTGTWVFKVDFEDGHSPEYYFYLCLFLIADFRYYLEEPWNANPRRQFYPKWFIRWLERQSWLRRNPEKMLVLTDKLGKFAHWSWYWTSQFPQKLASKSRTAIHLIREGNTEGLKAGFLRLSSRIALQLGLKRPAEACPDDGNRPDDCR